MISSTLAEIARNAGFIIVATDRLETLKRSYAVYALRNTSADQFDMMLAEALGMLDMNKDQLQKIANS